ncbi:MAG: leucine-rich repeat domain-containing protein [Cyanobacteriota/Melainabacteria group bacterium]
MSQENELCKDCGKKILTREIASITQWMFNTDICSCSSIRKASTENLPLDSTGNVCTRCGKRKRESGSGSMTQWIFGASLCSCDALRLKPNTEEEPGFPQILDSKDAEDDLYYSDQEPEEKRALRPGVLAVSLLILISGVALIAFQLPNHEKSKRNTSKSKASITSSSKRETTTLEQTTVPNSRINDKYLASLASRSAEENSYLRLNMSDITDDGLKHIEKLPVRILDISYTEIGDSGMDSITKLTNLTKLDMKACKITEKGLKKLSALKNLEILNVSGLNMTDPVMESISSLKKLDSIMMTGVQNLSPEGLKHFSKLPELTRLYLRTARITKEHTAILPQLKELRTLSLKDNELGDDDITALTKLSKLEILLLSGNKITDRGLLKLAPMKSLKQIELADMPLVTGKGIHRFQQLKPACLLILVRGNSVY